MANGSRLTYSEKLLDPRWQRKRLEVLERADFRCESCGSATETLHVHHKLYRRGAEPWEYDAATELASLCSTCHGEVELRSQELRALLSRLAEYDKDVVIGCVKALLLNYEGSDQELRNGEELDGFSAQVGRSRSYVLDHLLDGGIAPHSVFAFNSSDRDD